MSRSRKGKVKLDLEKLEHHDVKLLRRMDNLKREVVANRNLIVLVKKALEEKPITPTIPEA